MTKKRYVTRPPRFSRQWWWEQNRNIFWVVVVTVLVWVYADLEVTDKMEVKATLRLTTGQAKDMEIISERVIHVDFEVLGNRAALDRFERRINAEHSILLYDVSEDLQPGENIVPVGDILKRVADIEQAGLTLVSTSVSDITVQIDKVLTQAVPVKFEFRGATLSGTAKITPPQVRVRVSQHTWDNILKTAPAEGPV